LRPGSEKWLINISKYGDIYKRDNGTS
jgi:hypothetical protein